MFLKIRNIKHYPNQNLINKFIIKRQMWLFLNKIIYLFDTTNDLADFYYL